MNPLTQLDLDILTAGGCSVPGCTTHHHDPEMYIHSVCHVQADLMVKYDSINKCLHLECGVCEKKVAIIKVAEE